MRNGDTGESVTWGTSWGGVGNTGVLRVSSGSRTGCASPVSTTSGWGTLLSHEGKEGSLSLAAGTTIVGTSLSVGVSGWDVGVHTVVTGGLLVLIERGSGCGDQVGEGSGAPDGTTTDASNATGGESRVGDSVGGVSEGCASGADLSVLDTWGGPGPAGAWEDGSVWSGSALETVDGGGHVGVEFGSTSDISTSVIWVPGGGVVLEGSASGDGSGLGAFEGEEERNGS